MEGVVVFARWLWLVWEGMEGYSSSVQLQLQLYNPPFSPLPPQQPKKALVLLQMMVVLMGGLVLDKPVDSKSPPSFFPDPLLPR